MVQSVALTVQVHNLITMVDSTYFDLICARLYLEIDLSYDWQQHLHAHHGYGQLMLVLSATFCYNDGDKSSTQTISVTECCNEKQPSFFKKLAQVTKAAFCLKIVTFQYSPKRVTKYLG